MMIGLLILSFILFWGGGRKFTSHSIRGIEVLTSTQQSSMGFLGFTIGKILRQPIPGSGPEPQVGLLPSLR